MRRGTRLGSLHVRFMLMVIAGAIVFAALAGTAAYRHAHERALDTARASINGLIDAVATTAAIGAYASDRGLLQEVADGLALNPMWRASRSGRSRASRSPGTGPRPRLRKTLRRSRS